MPSSQPTPLAAALRLAVDVAPSLQDLAAWWVRHQPAIKRLSAEELAALVDHKDLKKEQLR